MISGVLIQKESLLEFLHLQSPLSFSLTINSEIKLLLGAIHFIFAEDYFHFEVHGQLQITFHFLFLLFALNFEQLTILSPCCLDWVLGGQKRQNLWWCF